MNPLVSIIVPVYNVEKYLKRCLSSIELQTYQNYEVLLVNDGSTDSSGEIIKEYAKNDRRFIVIDQPNGGLSAARNTGIKHAKGEYLYFLDSDDYIEGDAISVLVAALSQGRFDVVLANAYRVTENGRMQLKTIDKNAEYTSGEEYIVQKMMAKTYHPAVWMNLYSSKLILENQLYFAPGRLHEDVEWLPRVLLKAREVKEIRDIVYYYVIRKNSITTNEKQRVNGEHLMITAKELDSLKLSTTLNQNIFQDYLANVYMNGAYIGRFKGEEIDRFFPIKRANSTLCKVKSILFMLRPGLYYFFRRRAG